MSKLERLKSSWREYRNRIKHKIVIQCVSIEKKCEQLSKVLEKWAFLDILEYVGRFTVLVAVIFYIWGCEDRQKAKHYQAWQVINTAQGKPGNGGRVDALHDLHRDGISLVGIDLSKAYLPDLKLENANLYVAELAEAKLMKAKLSASQLGGANLTKAVLNNADLSFSALNHANLTEASLTLTDFYDANLIDANFTEAQPCGTDFSYANLTRANFTKANLKGAHFYEANLTEANLMFADLYDANFENVRNWRKIKIIKNANIYGVKNPPDGFLEWAKEHGAVSIEDESEWMKLRFERKDEIKRQKYQ